MTEFSKKTGDYPSLSAVDIQVLALTYQLEAELVGVSHLKQEPEKVNLGDWVVGLVFKFVCICECVSYWGDGEGASGP